MLELVDINKNYVIRKDKYQKVLKNLNVTFASKGFISILGNSGSGKTTMLNIIGGLDNQDSGKIYYNHEEVIDHEQFRRDCVGFVFQDYNLIDHLNAVDNVMLGMTDDIKHKKKTAKRILTEFGLETCFHKLPNQMSGGQRQRIAIARMIAKDVDIIICDEPTGSLDEQTELKVVEIIKKLSKDKLVLFVTHNRKLAEKYSDRIIDIKNGTATDGGINYENNHSLIQPQHKSYKSNSVWLAVKNLIGRYTSTSKNILLITFIMFLSSIALIMEGEFFKQYMHDNAMDKGIKTLVVDIVDDMHVDHVLNEFESIEHVEFASYGYDTQITLAATNYESTRIDIEIKLEEITNNGYIKDILSNGRFPVKSNEVLMSARGAIILLRDLNIGGDRLYDQFMTGEVDSDYVYSIIDDKQFIVAEYGYPRIKIVGLIDDKKIHETDNLLYFIDGFKNLFEYPRGLYPTKIVLYKDNSYRHINEGMLKVLESFDLVTINQVHQKKVDIRYNKIESFLKLSKISLYVISVIAAISFISLLFTSLLEREYEIGLYRAKGYNKKNITHILGLEMFFIEVISMVLLVLLLFASSWFVIYKVDYITSFSDILNSINVFGIGASLLVIVSFFVVVIVLFGRKTILKKSILSNIKNI